MRSYIAVLARKIAQCAGFKPQLLQRLQRHMRPPSEDCLNRSSHGDCAYRPELESGWLPPEP
jgi:hypothetical protein